MTTYDYLQTTTLVACLLMLLILLAFPQIKRRFRLHGWRKSLHLRHHHTHFETVFCGVNGFYLSKLARKNNNAIEYIYGEIEFESFIALLSLAKPNEKTVFYDLGSGVGKAVVACAMVFNVQKSYGIEQFSNLHQAASLVGSNLSRCPDYASKAQSIFFLQGDFLQDDLADATLVFINATGFIGLTWQKISQHINEKAPKATIITTTRQLANTHDRLVQKTAVMMSWGVVNAYIHQAAHEG